MNTDQVYDDILCEGMTWQNIQEDTLSNQSYVELNTEADITEFNPSSNEGEKIKKKKIEFSKVMVALCFSIGVLSIAAYYVLLTIAILTPDCIITPDSSLAVTGMSEIVASVLGYYLYQGFIKNSRNKYSVDECGKPWENAPYR